MKKIYDYEDALRPEYDFTKLTVVARVFPTAEAVNEALRFLIRIGKESRQSEQT